MPSIKLDAVSVAYRIAAKDLGGKAEDYEVANERVSPPGGWQDPKVTS